MAIIPSNEKFIGLAESVDTTEKRSALINAESQAYTMQDFTDTVRPYKVFTALLTQSGGDNPDQEVDGDQTIIKGVTYEIINVAVGDDLTKIGAPNNNAGTKFIASRDAIGEFNGATILFYNTGAPVATVLENTIGNIWFSYNDVGVYNINSISLFNENKTFVTISPTVENVSDSIGQTVQFVGGSDSTINKLFIQTMAAQQDGIPNNTPIEIRVYN